MGDNRAGIKNPKIPKGLDAIADVVLRYRPKPKSKPARRRKRLTYKALIA